MLRPGTRVGLRNLYLMLLLVLISPFASLAQERVKNVVIFFSYGPNLPAFEKILTGFNHSVRGTTNQPVNIMTEYFDMSRSVNDEYYPRFIINMYNNKVNTFPVDLLVTIGPGINDALLKYGSSELKSLNIINIDLNIPGRTTLHDVKIDNGIELLLKFQPGNTIRQAIKLFPDHDTIYVISGISPLDQFFTSMVRQVKNEFEPVHNFKFISGMNLDSTLKFVKTIPPKSILLVPAFLQDAAKVSFSTPEVMELFSQNSPAPVFLGITDGGFNGQGGGIGGYLFSYQNLGKELGRISHDILNGKSIKDMKVNEDGFYAHIYDWNELDRWKLTGSNAIPAYSQFYNKDKSILELYKWTILGTLLFIGSQTVLIAYLFRLNRRQKAITEKMLVTEGMYRELIHTDRVSKMSILTASLSHELFQPLSAIRLTAQAGKQFIQTDKLDSSKALQLFEHILEDETRATKLIRSVKGLMKAETADKENVNLNALIEETVDLIRQEAERDGIEIKVKLDPVTVFVLGDRIQLQQVLMNFIRNATTAMEKNEPLTKVLEIELKLNRDEVIVSVSDSGPGLDATAKDNLFKPFASTRKDGFGIGLTLCKSLIEKHHGKIWGENIGEGGARFSFSLSVNKNQMI